MEPPGPSHRKLYISTRPPTSKTNSPTVLPTQDRRRMHR